MKLVLDTLDLIIISTLVSYGVVLSMECSYMLGREDVSKSVNYLLESEGYYYIDDLHHPSLRWEKPNRKTMKD